MKKTTNQFKGGAVLSYINMAAGMIVSFLYTPVMLRILGQSEYGMLGLSNSIISYLGLFSFGFGNAIIRYSSKYRAVNDRERESRLYGMFISLYTFIAIIVCIVGAALVLNADVLFKQTLTIEELYKVKILMGVSIFSLAISFPLGVFNGVISVYERFVFPKIISLISVFASPIVILPLLFIGYKSIAIGIASAALTIAGFLMNVIYCSKVLKVKIIFGRFDLPLLKEIMVYSFFIFLGLIVDQITWSTDQVILGAVKGTSAVAVYSIASTLNKYYMSFSTNISSMFFPKVSRMITLNATDEEVTNIFIRVGRIQFIIVSFILSGFILFGKEFIIFWAGIEYEDAYFIALLIMIPITVPRIQNIGIYIQQAKNIHAFRSILYICIAVLNVIASIILAREYGGIGCAAATGISLLIGNGIIMNIYYKKKVNINIQKFWKEIFHLSIPVIFASVTGVIINILIKTDNLWDLAAKGLLFTAIFAILIWFFGMNTEEKSLFGGIAYKILNTINKSSKSIT